MASGNGLMLPWYVESMLLRHISRILLLHNVRQILRHIIEKYLKACMLLRYLHYTKLPFQFRRI